MNRLIFALILVFFLVASIGCNEKATRSIERPAKYHPAMLINKKITAINNSTVQLKFPRGYKLSPDAPQKIVHHPELTFTRNENSIVFHNPTHLEKAWVEVYYCEAEEAAICAFRPVELQFDKNVSSNKTTIVIPAP